MFINNNDTARGQIREQIIKNAKEDQVSTVEKKFWGNITLIGEKHKEAAEYLKEKLAECNNRGDEIKLHCEVEEKFEVALLLYKW